MTLENWKSSDEIYLRRAMLLAEMGRGSADPNPLVGAVVMAQGQIVGEGWHQRAGEPHAEVLALEAAGGEAQGSTLYINLEPCCHYGRTPPCVPRVIAAGVKRVVVGLVDPDPRVCGQGLAALAQAGLEVVTPPPELREQCAFLNQFFLASVSLGRPFVTLKYAMSLDGKLATRSGHSQWITGELARARVHQERSLHQAILVGRETVVRDDPHLNVRGYSGVRQPLRIVVDTRGSVSLEARVLSSPGGPVLFVTTQQSSPDWRKSLQDRGAEVVVVEKDESGMVSLREVLDHLHRSGIRSLLVEGGGQLHGSLIDQGLATRVLAFIAPRIVGGSQAPGPIGGRGAETMELALSLLHVKSSLLGPDFLVEGYLDESWLPG